MSGGGEAGLRARRPRGWRWGSALVLLCCARMAVATNTHTCARSATAVQAASEFLVDTVLPSGRMVYRQYPDGRATAPRYNLLRHAGALYAMTDAVVATPSAIPVVTPAVQRGARWLRRCCVHQVPGFEAASAAWSTPVRGSSRCAEAKLGGAALALLAYLAAERLTPGAVPVTEMRSLARFLVYQQREDGSFHSKFRPCHGGRDGRWVSLYYPGEAALALLRFAAMDGAPQWNAAAVAALDYLARHRAGATPREIPADHWAMLATDALFDGAAARALDAARRVRLLTHVRQVTRAIVQSPRVTDPRDPAHGSFGDEGRTTPTATRLEALLAARRLWQRTSPGQALVPELDAVIAEGIEFLLRAQRTEAPARGALPRAVRATTRRADELRIDYTQHALSAFVAYRTEVLGCR